MSLTNVIQLVNFVKLRNATPFKSNIQFQFDCEACGFEAEELGTPLKIIEDGIEAGYEWHTPYGKLIEQGYKIKLEVE
jgi:hypothetical protein